MVGAWLDKICVDDEVRYVEKYWRTRTSELENLPMVVINTDGLNQSPQTGHTDRTITVYNKSNSQFIEVVPSVLELITI